MFLQFAICQLQLDGEYLKLHFVMLLNLLTWYNETPLNNEIFVETTNMEEITPVEMDGNNFLSYASSLLCM